MQRIGCSRSPFGKKADGGPRDRPGYLSLKGVDAVVDMKTFSVSSVWTSRDKARIKGSELHACLAATPFSRRPFLHHNPVIGSCPDEQHRGAASTFKHHADFKENSRAGKGVRTIYRTGVRGDSAQRGRKVGRKISPLEATAEEWERLKGQPGVVRPAGSVLQ